MSQSQQGPWRVFLSHTSELRAYPSGGSYVDKAERAVIASGHVPVDMHDFPSIDEVPAQVCIDRVNGCDVYVGVYGTRWAITWARCCRVFRRRGARRLVVPCSTNEPRCRHVERVPRRGRPGSER